MTRAVEFACDHCGADCRAPAAATGGIVNCPTCGRATEVPGLRDPFWRLLKLGAILLIAGATTAVYLRLGLLPAVLVAVGLMLFFRLLSLAL